MNTECEKLAVEYIEAVGKRDFDRVSAMLSPDVRYTGPGGTLQGSKAYLAALSKLAPILQGNVVREVLADKTRACVVYDFNTDSPAGSVRSIEWLTFEGERIDKVELLFDLTKWPLALQELQRRAGTSPA